MIILARFAPWLSRIALSLTGIVLLMIARKFIGDPVHAAAASKTQLGSALAITNMRASFGAFPLGCALVALISVTSRRFHLSGLSTMATVLASVLVVRTYGVLADGTLRASTTVLTAETVLLCLCLVAIASEVATRRHEAG